MVLLEDTMTPCCRLLLVWISLGLSLAGRSGLAAESDAAAPEIAHVFPDFPHDGPRIITGENFELGKTELWLWTPPAVNEAQLLERLGDSERSLPETPPADARRAEVLDVERQVIVANLGPAVLWIKTPAGLSKPYALDLARPCWLNPERAEPRQIVYLFGFGLPRRVHRQHDPRRRQRRLRVLQRRRHG
jgi:hypothetical protein